ncbi:MAG: MoaD/ThiS family protein [Bacteroidota bacterium]
MPINIVAFGQLAEITGSDFEIEAADTEELMQLLREKFTALKEMKYAIAVNKKIVTKNTSLHNADMVALMPPFSGG